MRPYRIVLITLATTTLLAACVVMRNEPVPPRLEATKASMETYLTKDELGKGINAWTRAMNAGEIDPAFLDGYAGGLKALIDKRIDAAAAAEPAAMVQNLRNSLVFAAFQDGKNQAAPVSAARKAWYADLASKGFRQTALIYAIGNPDIFIGDAAFTTELLAVAQSLPNAWAAGRIRELAGRSDPVPSAPPVDTAAILKACATVWVDRGIKMENGIGMPDIVIGSAFFIEKDGYLLTNHHVIASEVDADYEGYSRLYIRLGAAQEKIPATVLGWDPEFDLALLKVAVVAPAVVPLSSLDSVVSGTRVLAFGSPGGLDNTVTGGIISNMDRRLLALGDVMQIDAAVNPGNSGGPLFTADGNFIGIVFAGIPQFQGVNFSVPAYWISDLLPRLAAGGKLSHPWLGVKLFEYRDRLRVLYVVPGSPAWNIGLAAGDEIDSFDGLPVQRIAQVYRRLGSLAPNDIIRLGWRPGNGELTGAAPEGRSYEGLCLLEPRPEHPLEAAAASGLSLSLFPPLFGCSVQDQSASPLSVDLKIGQVIPGSVADETGLSAGDTLSVLDWVYDRKSQILRFLFSTTRRSQGYLPQTLQLASPIDTEDFM
jgi:S1-C subfamily serine protease